ncbi:MAG TPA: phospholipid carrier-dependent glycosyltransferase [Gemmatimonadales bacterium]|nr:phospholipid carrier-dependent glycosyltransferase [Gemmatimonadales bacterium]
MTALWHGIQDRSGWIIALLLLTLCAELSCSIRHSSQTYDESVHVLAGYQYWRHGDFGANPEHPPLPKLVAAVPLLMMDLAGPPMLAGPTKAVHTEHGVEFLYRNSRPATDLLFASRLGASIFTYLLAVLVLLAAREMFGAGTGLLAMTLLVFEPNVLANGALVTTDVAVTTFLFAAVFAYYRYASRPTAWRLLACGAAVALALASKHSAVLLAGILPVVAAGDLLLNRRDTGDLAARALRTGLSLGVIVGIALVGLWAVYAFRFAARPEGLELSPPLGEVAWSLDNPLLAGAISTAGRWHLLPEAYLWGLADVLRATEGRPTFLLGRVYSTGQWFYFPVVFALKTTLTMLALLVAAPFALRGVGGPGRDQAAPGPWRAIWFLTVPPVLLFGASMASGLNLGFRHILPIVPFLVVLAAAAAVSIARRSRALGWVVATAVVAHAVSSVRAYPDYLTYSNEAAGGPARSHRLMTDANADWGQGLVQAARYLAEHGIRDCWFASWMAYVDPRDLGIPCRALQSSIRPRVVPPHPAVVEGTILVSASEMNGQWWGPGEMNPYGSLADRRPDALIANSILVFTGRFNVSLAAATARARRAQQLLQAERVDEAIIAAQEAVSLAPRSAEAQATMCRALVGAGRTPEAQPFCSAALEIADRVHPDYQYLRVPAVRAVAAMRRR